MLNRKKVFYAPTNKQKGNKKILKFYKWSPSKSINDILSDIYFWLKNNKKIAIGVLAYNEEKHIGDVLSELEKLDVPIFVVNDSSTDRTREILDEFYSRKVIEVINNKKNKGAGHSTLQLLKKTKSENFKYLLKVDGDNQFKASDIKRVINLLETEKYDFIKSNRFWSSGLLLLKRYR